MEKMEEEIVRAPSLRESQGWQPIESAPRDGTMILAFNGFFGVYSTAFTTRWTGRRGEEPYEGFPCGFHSSGLGSYPFGKWDCQPTHWMPLPDPPGGRLYG